MKKEFRTLSGKEIFEKRYVFLYGNFEEFISGFPYFFAENFNYDEQNLNSSLKTEKFSCNDFLKAESQQETLFDTGKVVYIIENILDTNYQALIERISTDQKNIFFLMAGDFRKSKQVNSAFTAHDQILAVPFFKNAITYENIFKKFLNNISKDELGILCQLTQNSTENFFSFLKKIILLKEHENDSENNIKEYYAEKQSFLGEFESIPLLRFLSSSYMKDPQLAFFSKEQKFPQDFKIKNLLEKCLKTETSIKKAKDIRASDILNPLFFSE